MKFAYYFVRFFYELLCLPLLVLVCLIASHRERRIDIGLGPHPLINNVYHKKALIHAGYTAETFVSYVWYITDNFDVRFDEHWSSGNPLWRRFLRDNYVFLWSAFRYRMIYLYFDGGPLGASAFLWRLEPWLYRLAKVKTVLLAYGSDVQDMSRSRNLLFKHAMARDYPEHRKRRCRITAKLDLWISQADHVVGGCEWVDYMHHWDTLMLAHFSIDIKQWYPTQSKTDDSSRPLRILHAPNHRNIKGTHYFIQAINELRAEGAAIELVLAERLSNEKIRELIQSVDIVADQLIVGWYAMFALEAMALEKPVLCYLREDLLQFYTDAGLVQADEIPIVHCNVRNMKMVISQLLENRQALYELGKRSRRFVEKHHSIEAVGAVFSSINKKLGILPRVRVI